MTHPDYAAALDRSKPLAARRAAYQRWADEHQPHVHPGRGWHAHSAGNRLHTHQEEATKWR